jgi:ATP-dependent DNA ligase
MVAQCACSPAAATTDYPAIAVAAAKLRANSFTLDGEAVVCGADGAAVFDALHRRHKASDAIRYAFDLLALDGAALRPLLARSNSG